MSALLTIDVGKVHGHSVLRPSLSGLNTNY
jgi:hypothetical protein